MGLFDNFPYMDLSNLNLDFILKNLKDLTNYTESAESNANRAETAKTIAVTAQNAAEAAARSAESSSRDAQAAEISAENYAAHIADPVGGLVTGWLDDNITPTTPPVDASLTIQGAAADAKATGDEIDTLRGLLSNAMPIEVKQALDTILQNVLVENASGYENEYGVFHAWATSVTVTSITATYTQTGVVLPMYSLELLRNDLVVRANYSDGTFAPVTAYDLIGTLTAGQSTITAVYQGMTSSFTVNVTAAVDVTPNLANAEAPNSSGTVTWDSEAETLRVKLTTAATYWAAKIDFTYETGYKYYLTCDCSVLAGNGRAGFRNKSDNRMAGASTTLSQSGHIDYYWDPSQHMDVITANPVLLCFFATWSTSARGDCIYSNIKVWKYQES